MFQHCLLRQDGEDLSAVGGTEGAGIVDELVGQTLGVSASGNDAASMLPRSTICGRGGPGRGGLVENNT